MPSNLISRTGTTGTTPPNRGVFHFTGGVPGTSEMITANQFMNLIGFVPTKIETIINARSDATVLHQFPVGNVVDRGSWNFSLTGGLPIDASIAFEYTPGDVAMNAIIVFRR